MKTVYALIIALGLVCSASVAFANPVGSDPSVIINGPHDPDCMDATCFSMNGLMDPLVITLDANGLLPVEDFIYTGTQTLTELYIQLDNAQPYEVFVCISNIFTGQCESFEPDTPNSVGLIFTGGNLVADEGFTAEVTAPEPGTLALLLSGMLGLMILGKKRWTAKQSA